MVDHIEELSGEVGTRVSGSKGPATKPTPPASLWGAIAVGVVFVALAVGTYALFRLDSWGDRAATTPERFQLDLASQMDIPAELLGYVERRRFDLSQQEPCAITVTPNGRVYVAGDTSIEVIQPDGTSTSVPLTAKATCLAVSTGENANVSRLYVGMGRRVVVLSEEGELLQQWPDVHAKSVLTSIAVSGDNVFVADAGQQVVLHFRSDGQLIGTIGEADPDRQMPGFIIPSPYFDLVIDQDEVLHVVNPGMRRVEAYNFDGELQSYWGSAGSSLPNFFGCCNPAYITLMPDGQFITSEKGIPRVKVYSPGGDLERVVAGPRQLGVKAAALGDARGNQKERVFDVTVDGAGTVFVLDPHRRQVIVFEPRAKGAGSES